MKGFHIFTVVVLVGFLLVTDVSAAKKRKQKKALPFSDDEDQLMLRDEAVSSGESPDDLFETAPGESEPDLEELINSEFPEFPSNKPAKPSRPNRPPQRPSGCSSRRCSSRRGCSSRRRCQSSAVTLPSSYAPAQVCGRQYYCRKGFRGPCNRNEIFTATEDYDTRAVSVPTQSTCSRRPRSCISASSSFTTDSSETTGYCKLRYSSAPCYSYPSNYRYCKRTKQCYPTSEDYSPDIPSPCQDDQYFTSVDQSYGTCRCRGKNEVRCKNTNRCYPAYTQGSCKRGQWLVPSGSHGYSTCQRCPCPSQADGQHIYWSGKGHRYGRPGCYKSNTQGPCRRGMRFVVDDMMTGSSKCVSQTSQWYDSDNSIASDWELFYGEAAVMDQPVKKRKTSRGTSYIRKPVSRQTSNDDFSLLSDRDLFFGE